MSDNSIIHKAEVGLALAPMVVGGWYAAKRYNLFGSALKKGAPITPDAVRAAVKGMPKDSPEYIKLIDQLLNKRQEFPERGINTAEKNFVAKLERFKAKGASVANIDTPENVLKRLVSQHGGLSNDPLVRVHTMADTLFKTTEQLGGDTRLANDLRGQLIRAKTPEASLEVLQEAMRVNVLKANAPINDLYVVNAKNFAAIDAAISPYIRGKASLLKGNASTIEDIRDTLVNVHNYLSDTAPEELENLHTKLQNITKASVRNLDLRKTKKFKIYSNKALDPIKELERRGLSEEVLSPLRKAHAEGKLNLTMEAVVGPRGGAIKHGKYLRIQQEGGSFFRLHLPEKFGSEGRLYRNLNGRGFVLAGVATPGIIDSNQAVNYMSGDEMLFRRLGRRVEAGIYNLGKEDVADFRKLLEYQHTDFNSTLLKARSDRVYGSTHANTFVPAEGFNIYNPKETVREVHRLSQGILIPIRSSKNRFVRLDDSYLNTPIKYHKGNQEVTTTIGGMIGEHIRPKDQFNFVRSNMKTEVNVIGKATGNIAAGVKRGDRVLNPIFDMKIGVMSAGELREMQDIVPYMQILSRETMKEMSANKALKFSEAVEAVRARAGKDTLLDRALQRLDKYYPNKYPAGAVEREAALAKALNGNSLKRVRAIAEMNAGEGAIDAAWVAKNIEEISIPSVFSEMDTVRDYKPKLREFKKYASSMDKKMAEVAKANTKEAAQWQRLFNSKRFQGLSYQDQVELFYRTELKGATGASATAAAEALDRIKSIKRSGLVVETRGQTSVMVTVGTDIGMKGGRAVNVGREPGIKHYRITETPGGVISEGIVDINKSKRWAGTMSGMLTDRLKKVNMDVRGGLEDWAGMLEARGETERAGQLRNLVRNVGIDSLEVAQSTHTSHAKSVAQEIVANLSGRDNPKFWYSHYSTPSLFTKIAGIRTGKAMPFTMETGFELINAGGDEGQLAEYLFSQLDDVNPKRREFITNLNKYVTEGKFEDNPLDLLPTVNESYMGLEGTSASQKIKNLSKGFTPEMSGGYKYESKLTGELNVLDLARKAGIEQDSTVWRQLEGAARMETFYAPGTNTGIHEAVQAMNQELGYKFAEEMSGLSDRTLHVTDINRSMANIAGIEEKILQAKGNTTLIKSHLIDYAAATNSYLKNPAMAVGGKYGLMRNLGSLKNSVFVSVQSSIEPTLNPYEIIFETNYETLRKIGLTSKRIKEIEQAGRMSMEEAGIAILGKRFPVTGEHMMQLKIANDLVGDQAKISFAGDMISMMDRDNDLMSAAIIKIGEGGISKETARKFYEHQAKMIEYDTNFSKEFSSAFNFKQAVEDVGESEMEGSVLEGLIANAEGGKDSKIIRDAFDKELSTNQLMKDKMSNLTKALGSEAKAKATVYDEYLLDNVLGQFAAKKTISAGTIPTATSAKRLTFALAELGGISTHADQIAARNNIRMFGKILQQVPIWGQKHAKSAEEIVDFAKGVRNSMAELSRGNEEGLTGFFRTLGGTKLYQKEITAFYQGTAHKKLAGGQILVDMGKGASAETFAASNAGIDTYFEKVFEPTVTSLRTAVKERPEEAGKMIKVMKDLMANKGAVGGATMDDYARAAGLNFGNIAEKSATKGLMEEAEAATKMFAGKAKKAFGAKGFALGALATMGALTVMGMAQSPNRSGPIIPPAYRRRAEEQTPRVDMNTINNGGIFNKMMNWFNPEQPQGMSVRGQVNSSTSVNPEHVSTQINNANPGGRNNLSVQYRTDNLLSVRTKRRMKGEL